MYSTRYFGRILIKFEFSRQIFEKVKFYQNQFSGSRVVPCGRTDGQTDRQTDMTKLIVTFRNIANAPKKRHINTIVKGSANALRVPSKCPPVPTLRKISFENIQTHHLAFF